MNDSEVSSQADRLSVCIAVLFSNRHLSGGRVYKFGVTDDQLPKISECYTAEALRFVYTVHDFREGRLKSTFVYDFKTS